MTSRTRAALATITAGLAMALAACTPAPADPTLPGVAPTGDATASASATVDPQDAMLAYAQCMRDNGVPMEDPKPDGGIALNGEGLEPGVVEAASAACQSYLDNAESQSQRDPAADQEMFEKQLKVAACMRERGYDYPDPVMDQSGRISQSNSGAGPQVDQAQMQADQQACAVQAGLPAPGESGSGSSTSEG
jgi:hypothetical protein